MGTNVKCVHDLTFPVDYRRFKPCAPCIKGYNIWCIHGSLIIAPLCESSFCNARMSSAFGEMLLSAHMAAALPAASPTTIHLPMEPPLLSPQSLTLKKP